MESFINDDDSLPSTPFEDNSRCSSENCLRKLGSENNLLRTSFRRRRKSACPTVPDSDQQIGPPILHGPSVPVDTIDTPPSIGQASSSQTTPIITVSDLSVKSARYPTTNYLDPGDLGVSDLNQAKLVSKLKKLVQRWYLQLKEDFSEVRPFEIDNKPLFECEESFSIKYTTEALNRFDDIFEALVDGPVRDAYNEYLRITQWSSPILTLLTFVVLVYSLWTEYLMTIVFLIFSFVLLRNYMIEKKWILQKDPLDIDNRRRTNAVRLTNLFQLNMRVTTALHMLTDLLDKFLALCTWKKPTITAFLLGFVLSATILSVFVPVAFFGKLIGTVISVKVFFLDYIFMRFPRVRAKYDILYIWFNELPTGKDLERQRKFNNSLKPSRSSNELSSLRSAFDPSVTRKVEYKLSVLFKLNQIESLASGWSLGKRCTLINKEKTLTGAKSGRLFLTEKNLLFLRFKTPSPKNVAILLKSIVNLEKTKYSGGWLPGDSKSIEITTEDGTVYTFSAIESRDNVFREISERLTNDQYQRLTRAL